ncbi:Phosphopantetheine adenylyltransferase [Alloiococcus otitis]|uniref:Phosphopantetheine adenylyltransferase n=1 Tax=Alloiococcus otitis ATCC 51267 TaxID=883081 RepID=K9EBU4_9LACT|nr:pantetheine-phosphate adenylyltransferase [Alloiococcus otitis]EKU94163.1 pantetheine-phosphate adenylyltransferase [Alloiococcus otitis ATCC 51267]SUU81204.1 Phosphopantetheine adenylyltransferase [Alloiococcus otitis]
MNRAIYAGSFDPITKGHMDIIKRASKIFDEIIVAVANNTSKNSMLDLDTKLVLINQSVRGHKLENVYATKLETGLIVDFAREKDAKILIRGLRSVKDFDYESSIEDLNKVQDPNIETVYLLSSARHRSISSTVVREIIQFEGQIEQLVPKPVVDYFQKNK